MPIFVGFLSMGLIFVVLNLELVTARIAYMQQSSQLQARSIQPQQALTPDTNSEPIINNRLYIPKIQVDLPVVFDMKSTNESDVQYALRSGVLHYGQTAMPGEKGNVVIVGHSSGPLWAPGDYKFAFTLLDKLSVGDVITINYQGVEYSYEVSSQYTVVPSEIAVLNQSVAPELTLITCTPVGTSKSRLIIKARQISPNPENAKPLVANGIGQEVVRLPN